MLAGIILIAAGLLIAVFPPLLAWVVALLLVLAGFMLISVGYYNRKIAHHYDNPFIEVFFRF